MNQKFGVGFIMPNVIIITVNRKLIHTNLLWEIYFHVWLEWQNNLRYVCSYLFVKPFSYLKIFFNYKIIYFIYNLKCWKWVKFFRCMKRKFEETLSLSTKMKMQLHILLMLYLTMFFKIGFQSKYFAKFQLNKIIIIYCNLEKFCFITYIYYFINNCFLFDLM